MILCAIVPNLLSYSPQSLIYLLFHFGIISALQGLRQFDKCAIPETLQANRCSATLDDEYHEDTTNIRFALGLCFVGDMPQQQANAGVTSKLVDLSRLLCVLRSGFDNYSYFAKT